MKKLYALIVAALLVCAAMAMTACGGDGAYKVTVKDSAGNPCSEGVVVLFTQNGTQVAMQVCDENGVAKKELEAGEYTVQLQFTDADASYYYEKATLTAKEREVEIVLMNGVSEDETTELYVGDDGTIAYHVEEGTTYVPFETVGRNYFIFTPTRGGMYEISVETETEVTIGYYGAPHFVQEFSIEEPVDGVITVSIKDAMVSTGETGTTRMVIGIDVTDESLKNGKLTVKRIGDPEVTLSDLPWDIYQVSVDLVEYVMPEGATLGEFDVTAEDYTIVFNEEDGYYHKDTADGPLVVVYLAEDPPVPYVPCFMTILSHTGINKYFYDEDGEFVKKENYTDCLLKYIEVADMEYGVYPLTEDLYYILHQKNDWWEVDNPNFIFKETDGTPLKGLNTEIAWLFMCGYVIE